MTALRDIEARSIRAFVQSCADRGYLTGKVLDYGCGRRPYQGIVEAAGGDYWGWDSPGNPGYVADYEGSVFHMGANPADSGEHLFDAILCTQVIQYLDDPLDTLAALRSILRRGGLLLMTGPTNWPHVEKDDKWRFTVNGIAVLLDEASFRDPLLEARAQVRFEGESWVLGWQVVARR